MTDRKKRGLFRKEKATYALASLFLSLSVLLFFLLEVRLKTSGISVSRGFQLAVAVVFAGELFNLEHDSKAK